MGKLDELKGKAKATVDNVKDRVDEAKEKIEREADEAKGYEEVRDRT